MVGVSEDESEAFLDQLNAEACQRPRIHHQGWRETSGRTVMGEDTLIVG